MKYINELREGNRISGIYLCKHKQSAVTKNGKQYENVILQDKTGIPKGVLISRVADDSPAMMAGMKEYDVIVKLGEHKVETIKQYHEQLGKYSTGDVVTVTAMRKGAEGYAEMTFDVTMGEV